MDENFEYEHYTPEADSPIPAEMPAYKPKYEKKSSKKGILAAMLCCSLLGGIVGAGGILLADRLTESQEVLPESEIALMLEGQRESTVIQTVPVDTGRQMTPAEVYAANVRSTVGITTSVTTNFWGYQTTSAASGSGFIISEDGYILTNYHVIESSDSISVSLYDGSSYDATLIGYDESNDIAVLKIEAEKLSPVILGDSDNLNVGDTVIAIGNPLGELTFSLTAGLVSAMDREVTFSGSITMELIQTDCAINSGNSGGALFNLYGEVIGITNAKYSGSSASGASIDNIGFAIPLNDIRGIVTSIIEKGYISKPYLGISVSDVSAEVQAYGIPAGAAIRSVAAESPAEKAGLQEGDIVTAANGNMLSGSSELVELVSELSVGSELVLSLYRQGQTVEVTVVIEEQIQSALAGEAPRQQIPQRDFPWSSGSGRR